MTDLFHKPIKGNRVALLILLIANGRKIEETMEANKNIHKNLVNENVGCVYAVKKDSDVSVVEVTMRKIVKIEITRD